MTLQYYVFIYDVKVDCFQVPEKYDVRVTVDSDGTGPNDLSEILYKFCILLRFPSIFFFFRLVRKFSSLIIHINKNEYTICIYFSSFRTTGLRTVDFKNWNELI